MWRQIFTTESDIKHTYKCDHLTGFWFSPVCCAGTSVPALSSPGTTTTRWAVCRARCSTATVGQPTVGAGYSERVRSLNRTIVSMVQVTYWQPVCQTIWNDIWLNGGKLCDVAPCCFGQSEDWNVCVLQATHTCNVWCNIFSPHLSVHWASFQAFCWYIYN